MEIRETYTSAKYGIELVKRFRGATLVKVVRRGGPYDDGVETVYDGDLAGFTAFTEQLVELFHKAQKFDAIEVPNL